MSQLHRNIFAQIMAGLEPVVETAVAAFVPEGVVLKPLIEAGATAAETALDGPAPAAADPTKVLPADYVSPVAAAPAPPASSAPAAAAAAPAPAPLSAADVIAALLSTLQALQARV
jgi:hypothetical protein